MSVPEHVTRLSASLGAERVVEVFGFPGYYVTDTGKVISTKHSRLIVRKPWADRDGYLQTAMYLPNDGNIAHLCITRKIHHIVLESFGIFRPTKHHVADHINGIRNDNRLVNLRWVTTADNTRHAIEDRFGGTTWMAGNSYGSLNGGPNHYRASLTEAQVREILAALLSGVSQKQLSEKYGVRRTTISRIKTGARWSCVTNIAGGNKQ